MCACVRVNMSTFVEIKYIDNNHRNERILHLKSKVTSLFEPLLLSRATFPH